MSGFRTPRGTQDRLPAEQSLWDLVTGTFERQCKLFGFARIQTPTFESTALFARGVGAETDIVTKEMYTFEDRGGESLTLRAEGTAPVVRAYGQHGLKALPQPVRLYYVAPIFRYERPQAGRFREHYQMGVEVLGEPDASVDAEAIALIWRVFEELGLRQLSLQINSIGDPVCRPSYLEALVGFYRDKVDQLCQDCKRRLERNPLRLLDCKQEHCESIARGAPRATDHLCPACATHYDELKRGLEALGIDYVENPRLVRGLDYYTRTVFEIWPPKAGSQSTLAGGGRYDLLSEYLGGDALAGMGFGCGIERVVLNLREQAAGREEADSAKVFVAPLSSAAKAAALSLAADLRRLGVTALSGYRDSSPRAQLRRANSVGARIAVMIGDRELQSGKVTVRDMDRNSQTDVEAATAARSIADLLDS